MIIINDKHHFDAEIASAGEKLVIADFFADWCGPCKLIAPGLENLATKYPDTLFLKIDVDECMDLALVQEVSALPTFVFYKNQKILDRLQGSLIDELEAKIKNLLNETIDAPEDESTLKSTKNTPDTSKTDQKSKTSRDSTNKGASGTSTASRSVKNLFKKMISKT